MGCLGEGKGEKGINRNSVRNSGPVCLFDGGGSQPPPSGDNQEQLENSKTY